MKKNILSSVAIAAVAALSLASCNKSQPQVEAKSETKASTGLKVAYVEVDSIMTQYTFAKEYSSILEKKGQNIQATIAQKGQQLQAAAANFQQKIQQNAASFLTAKTILPSRGMALCIFPLLKLTRRSSPPSFSFSRKRKRASSLMALARFLLMSSPE